jgi:hypothetical protein
MSNPLYIHTCTIEYALAQDVTPYKERGHPGDEDKMRRSNTGGRGWGSYIFRAFTDPEPERDSLDFNRINLLDGPRGIFGTYTQRTHTITHISIHPYIPTYLHTYTHASGQSQAPSHRTQLYKEPRLRLPYQPACLLADRRRKKTGIYQLQTSNTCKEHDTKRRVQQPSCGYSFSHLGKGFCMLHASYAMSTKVSNAYHYTIWAVKIP